MPEYHSGTSTVTGAGAPIPMRVPSSPQPGDLSVRRFIAVMISLGVLAIAGQSLSLWAWLEFADAKKAWEATEKRRDDLSIEIAQDLARIEDLREQVISKASQAETATEMLREIQARQNTVQIKLDQYKREQDRASEDIGRASAELASVTRSTEDASTKLDDTQESLNLLSAQLPQLEKDKELLENGVEQLEQREDMLLESLDKKRKVEVRLREELTLLEPQATAARQLRNEKSNLVQDVRVRTQQRNDLKEELATLEGSRAHARDDLERMRARAALLELKEEEGDTLQNSVDQLRQKNSELQHQNVLIQQRTAELKGPLELAREELIQAQNRAALLKLKQDEGDTLQNRVDLLRQKNSELQHQYDKIQEWTAELKGPLELAREELNSAQVKAAALKQIREDRDALLAQIAGLEQQKVDLARLTADLKGSSVVAREQLESAQARAAELGWVEAKKRDLQDQVEELDSSIHQKRDLKLNLESEVEDLQARATELKREAGGLERSAASFSDSIANAMQSFAAELRRLAVSVEKMNQTVPIDPAEGGE